MRPLSYWILPVVAGLVWLGMLLGLLLHWIVGTNCKFYPSMSNTGQRIAYISDVGAYELKPLFVAGCVITSVLFEASFLADRWLRHKGRLVPNTTPGEKVLKTLTIVFALIGAAGLILLSVFDTATYPRLHNGFLLFFMGGYLLSAVFICWEYQRLGSKNREHRVLRASFWIKLVFILVEFCLTVAFVVTNFAVDAPDAAAVLEWIIALVVSAYIFSFFIDLWPAVYTRPNGARHHRQPKQTPRQMEEVSEQSLTTAADQHHMDRVPANF